MLFRQAGVVCLDAFERHYQIMFLRCVVLCLHCLQCDARTFVINILLPSIKMKVRHWQPWGRSNLNIVRLIKQCMC